MIQLLWRGESCRWLLHQTGQSISVKEHHGNKLKLAGLYHYSVHCWACQRSDKHHIWYGLLPEQFSPSLLWRIGHVQFQFDTTQFHMRFMGSTRTGAGKMHFCGTFPIWESWVLALEVLSSMLLWSITRNGVRVLCYESFHRKLISSGDDLSMLLATATVLHRIHTFDTSTTTTVVAGLVMATLLTAFSIWHCVTDEIVMHALLFGIMIALVGIQTRSVISRRVPNPAVKKEVYKLCKWGGSRLF